ncbi:TetR/AcrR family transcriptional regulator [Holzapfeliella sp. He02]|uniref:TetR/AcrR family transcriptional regulator n=1 Tax=Holzapfeliella saturejae TaxID=3082953 RepID=A0ABU8SGQ0_9LACO
MATYTKKTQQTDRIIRRAFLRVLKTKSFDFVTVSDIVKEANIHRSSFYRYFDDKYQLAECIEKEIMGYMRSERLKWMDKHPKTTLADPEAMAQLFKSIDFFAPAINILLSPNGDPSFEVRLRNAMFKNFFKNSKFDDVEDDKIELMKLFSINTIIETYKYWTSPHRKLTAEELAEMLSDMYKKGFIYAVNHL